MRKLLKKEGKKIEFIMGRYTQTFELSKNLAMFYTRCYMLAHLTRNDKHKDCALAYNVLYKN